MSEPDKAISLLDSSDEEEDEVIPLLESSDEEEDEKKRIKQIEGIDLNSELTKVNEKLLANSTQEQEEQQWVFNRFKMSIQSWSNMSCFGSFIQDTANEALMNIANRSICGVKFICSSTIDDML